MADISLSSLDELYSKAVELIEIITRVSDLPRLKTEPSNHF